MTYKRLICCLSMLSALHANESSSSKQFADSVLIERVTSKTVDYDWYFFTKAIAWQESHWNDKAVGPTNDLGYLQITPIYVAEANRLSKLKNLGKTYVLSDRLNRTKSIEMFNIIQGHYNPKHSKTIAIKLHNPGASPEYGKNIMAKYKQLTCSRQNVTIY